VRKKITVLATLVVIAVLVAASIGLVASQRRLLTENLDESIGTTVDQLQAQVEQGRLPARLTGLGEDDTVAQVVRSGTVIAASANVAGEPPVATPPGGRERLRTVTGLPNDAAAFRLVSRRVDGPQGPVVIHVAGTLGDIHDSTKVLATSLTVVVPAVALLLAGLIWWLVGRTLRPVEAIRAEVADIGGTGLDRRVPVPPGNDEIARLARTMNTMLERVDDAAQRQARFVADASHELRSPLTRMRSELEVDLAGTSNADLAATHRSVLDETMALQRLVEDLLHLARVDADPAPTDGALVDLDDIALEAARTLRAGNGVAVDITGVAAVQVVGHRVQLARVVGNLVDNAARHASHTVTLTLAEKDHAAVLAVSDDGPGIAPADRERIFDRFTRLDDARTAGTGGAGLGLAIARDLVRRHGGTLTLDEEHQPGARFVVILPLDKAATGSGR
jgi:signal transduction histidine kinase